MKTKKSFFICIAVVLVAVVNVANADLISHWKFDETGGTIVADSKDGNPGTIYGAASWSAGKLGNALNFNGTNTYVDVGDKDNLDFGATTSFTIAAWIKAIQTPQGGAIVLKRRVGGEGTFYEGYKFVLSNNKLYLGMQDNSGNRKDIFGNTVVADNQWHHIAAVRDVSSDKLYLYLDGEPDATPVTDNTTGTLATSQSFWIGRQPYYNSYFNGGIDDVRIYNQALSAEEVRQLYFWEARNLVGLEITGLNEVPDNNSVCYTTTAIYDNNSTEDVTLKASWSVDANCPATIDANGVLTTGPLETLEEAISISAEYTDNNNVTVAARKEAVVSADCTIAELVSRNIHSAIEIKQRILEDIDRASEKERRAMVLFGTFGTDASFSSLSKQDFATIKKSAALAIRNQTQGKDNIGRSIGTLENILTILGLEPLP
jgi:hypothetical protein